MKPRTTKETAMICVAAVLVVTVLTIGPDQPQAHESSGSSVSEIELMHQR
jgi:hypothetical protein